MQGVLLNQARHRMSKMRPYTTRFKSDTPVFYNFYEVRMTNQSFPFKLHYVLNMQRVRKVHNT